MLCLVVDLDLHFSRPEVRHLELGGRVRRVSDTKGFHARGNPTKARTKQSHQHLPDLKTLGRRYGSKVDAFSFDSTAVGEATKKQTAAQCVAFEAAELQNLASPEGF